MMHGQKNIKSQTGIKITEPYILVYTLLTR